MVHGRRYFDDRQVDAVLAALNGPNADVYEELIGAMVTAVQRFQTTTLSPAAAHVLGPLAARVRDEHEAYKSEVMFRMVTRNNHPANSGSARILMC